MGLDVRKCLNAALTWENQSSGFVNNKDANLHMICTLIIGWLESSIFKLVIGEISIFYLVPEAEQTDLSIALSETTDFFPTRPIFVGLFLDLNIQEMAL